MPLMRKTFPFPFKRVRHPFRGLGGDEIFVEADVDRIGANDRGLNRHHQNALVVSILDSGAKTCRRRGDGKDDVASLAHEIVELRELDVDVVVGVGDDEIAGGQTLLLVVLDERLVFIQRVLPPANCLDRNRCSRISTAPSAASNWRKGSGRCSPEANSRCSTGEGSLAAC